jgi:hypothetical protein
MVAVLQLPFHLTDPEEDMDASLIPVAARAERSFDKERISGVLVRLTVGGTQYLHVSVGADGTLERGGRGEREFSTKLESPELFAEILGKVSPELLRWAGQSWSDPLLRGKTCELLIRFRDAAGGETATRWKYGTDSPEPPREIRDFILSLVEATNPWYREQIEFRQARARRRPDAVWHLVPRLPTCETHAETIQ